MEILGIWIGYGIAVVGTAFGTKSGPATAVVGISGAAFAMFATLAVAKLVGG